MRGTRYGDYSRFASDPAKRYSGVLMQQGRVQLDADFNEQSNLHRHALRVALADLFGGSCAPATAPGYRLRPRVALELDGSVRLAFEQPRELQPRRGQEHTLELWLSWRGGAGVLLDCRDADASTGYQLKIDRHGVLVLELEIEGSNRGMPITTLTATQRLPSQMPVHLALVLGGDFAGLYLDGRQVGRTRHAGLGDLDAPRIMLGGPLGDPSPALGFVGLVSGVRAWRTARTLAQLASATALGPQVEQDPALLAVWPFDECRGSLLTDTLAGHHLRAVSETHPSWRLMDLVIEPGRFYVDGVPCELSEKQLYSRQPAAAGTPLPTTGQHLAYLEVWEESVSAVQDPALREVALGGLDTSVRTRTASCVRVVAVDPLPDPGDDAAPARVLAAARLLTSGRLAAQHTGDRAPGNHLYRVEIHDGGHHGADTANGSNLARGPSFKWSRDNGASLFALADTEHGSATVAALPAAGVEALAPGDIVEPLGAGASLDGPAHPLLRVEHVSDQEGQITLSGQPPPGIAYLRRWDHNPGPEIAATGPVGAQLQVRPGWIELEDGIHIRFEDGDYRRGDYWWIVSRQDLRGIEWPHKHGHPVALPPSGVERLTAPLALLSLDRDDEVWIEDVRRIVSAIVAQRPQPNENAEPEPPPPAPPKPQLVVAVIDDEQETEVVIESERKGIQQTELPQARQSTIEPPAEQQLERDLGTVEPHAADGASFWRRMALLDLPANELQAAANIGDAIVVATHTELFIVSLRSTEAVRLTALPVPRHASRLCAVIDRLLVVGGGPEPERADGRVFGLKLSSRSWKECARLPVPRSHPAVAVARGRVHAIGGSTYTQRRRVHGAHHVYDPHADQWSQAAPLPTPRSGAAAIALGDRLHVVGGDGGGRAAKPRVEHEAFDLKRGTWHTQPPLPSPKPVIGSCSHHGRHAVLLDDPDGQAPQSPLEFDPAKHEWTELSPLPERLTRPIVAGHDEQVHVLGTNADGAIALYRLP